MSQDPRSTPTNSDDGRSPAPSVPPGPDRAGQLIKEKWRVDRLLGAGGMAAVYSATHRNGNRVAIKFLHPMYVADQSLRARFQREGYVANLIEHAAVVRVLDDDVTDDGTSFLVMELLEGETLQARLNRLGSVPVEEALVIAYQVLDVLVKAHGKGIVHRDIKPDNIFLTSNGQVKVLDFGIARLAELSDRGVNQTRQGALLGTPAYMAPEQALERTEAVDGQTDVWAVGATLFRMLTGRTVRSGDTFSQQLLAAATQPVPPLSSAIDNVPFELGLVVDRATAFHREHRWGSAADMQAAIRPQLVAVPESQPPGPLAATHQQPHLRYFAGAHPAVDRTPGSRPGLGQNTLPMGELVSRGSVAEPLPASRRRGLFVGVTLMAALLAGWAWRQRQRIAAGGSVAPERAPGAATAPDVTSGAPPRALSEETVRDPLPNPPAKLPETDAKRAGSKVAVPKPPSSKKAPTPAPKRATRPVPQNPTLMDDDELLGRRH